MIVIGNQFQLSEVELVVSQVLKRCQIDEPMSRLEPAGGCWETGDLDLDFQVKEVGRCGD